MHENDNNIIIGTSAEEIISDAGTVSTGEAACDAAQDENYIVQSKGDSGEQGRVGEGFSPPGSGVGVGFPLPDTEGIKQELAAMKERLDCADRRASLLSEIRELTSAVPNADLRILDEKAYEDIENGKSLVLSYLLCERRISAAKEANAANASSSTGMPNGGSDSLFSIEEIKNMDRKAIRKNLDKVMKSLERKI